MPNYVVHIGPPKTGTKYLQHSLYKLRETMLRDAINYPNDMWTHKREFSHFRLVEEIKKGPNAQVESLFRRLNDSGNRTIVLSCEGFVSLDRAQIDYLRGLIGDAPVEVVYFCRRWCDWLPSSWKESVKQGSCEAFPEMLTRLFVQGPENTQAINFCRILDRFSDVFGTDSIRILSYSNIVDKGADVTQEFLKNILHRSYDTSGETKSMNSSPSIEETELLRLFNALDAPEAAARARRLLFGKALPFLKADPVNQARLERTFARMNKHRRHVRLSDNGSSLQPIYAEISRKYGSQMVGGTGSEIFSRESREIAYISADHVLRDNALQVVEELYGAARGHLLG